MKKTKCTCVFVRSLEEAESILFGLHQSFQDYLEKLKKELKQTPWVMNGKRVSLSMIAVPIWVKRRHLQSKIRLNIEEKDEQMLQSFDSLESLDSNDKAPPRLWKEVLDEISRAVVLGEPGSGKTFCAQWTTLHLIEQAYRNLERGYSIEQTVLPIYGRLPKLVDYLDEKDIFHILARYVASEWNMNPSHVLELLQRSETYHNNWFIGDGLDELPPDTPGNKRRSKMYHFLKKLDQTWKGKIILTCRQTNYSPHELEWNVIEEYELLPFDVSSQFQFIEQWPHVTNQKHTLSSLIEKHENLRKLCQYPLFLTFLCLLSDFAQIEECTKDIRQGDLYQNLILHLIQQWNRVRNGTYISSDMLYVRYIILQELAWYLFRCEPMTRTFSFEMIEKGLENAVNTVNTGINEERKPHEWLQEFVEIGILQQVGWKPASIHYAFVHPSILEFLAGGALAHRVNMNWNEWKRVIDHTSWDPAWWEVLQFMAWALKDEPYIKTIQLLSDPKKDDFFRHRTILALRLMNERKRKREEWTEIESQIIKEIMQYGVEHELFASKIHIWRSAYTYLVRLMPHEFVKCTLDLYFRPPEQKTLIHKVILQRANDFTSSSDLSDTKYSKEILSSHAMHRILARFPPAISKSYLCEIVFHYLYPQDIWMNEFISIISLIKPDKLPDFIVSKIIEFLDTRHFPLDIVKALGDLGHLLNHEYIVNKLYTLFLKYDLRNFSLKILRSLTRIDPEFAFNRIIQPRLGYLPDEYIFKLIEVFVDTTQRLPQDVVDTLFGLLRNSDDDVKKKVLHILKKIQLDSTLKEKIVSYIYSHTSLFTSELELYEILFQFLPIPNESLMRKIINEMLSFVYKKKISKYRAWIFLGFCGPYGGIKNVLEKIRMDICVNVCKNITSDDRGRRLTNMIFIEEFNFLKESPAVQRAVQERWTNETDPIVQKFLFRLLIQMFPLKAKEFLIANVNKYPDKKTRLFWLFDYFTGPYWPTDMYPSLFSIAPEVFQDTLLDLLNDQNFNIKELYKSTNVFLYEYENSRIGTELLNFLTQIMQ